MEVLFFISWNKSMKYYFVLRNDYPFPTTTLWIYLYANFMADWTFPNMTKFYMFAFCLMPLRTTENMFEAHFIFLLIWLLIKSAAHNL
jgi:hypothetical protein